MSVELWIFLAYTLGTLFGLYVGSKVATYKIVERTIDDLILKKIIKTKTVDGETEILQYDEN
jgi:hypothetical protein|tara:strand:+ start:4947 stop:5132 length:186 start_codon:yes stop_codon:yes gene_type:complete